MNLSDETWAAIINELINWGPFGIAFLIFMIFGMPHVAPIISALGTIYNERQKTKLSHERSMTKIENQTSGNGRKK